MSVPDLIKYDLTREDLPQGKACMRGRAVFDRLYPEGVHIIGEPRKVMRRLVQRAVVWPWGVAWAQKRGIVPRIVCEGEDFCGQRLVTGHFGKAVFRECNFEDARLWHANLRYADLRGSFFHGANLEHADLRFTNLCDVDMTDISISSVRPSPTRFYGALYDRQTRLPQCIDPELEGMVFVR